jgi:hypothetical protein
MNLFKVFASAQKGFQEEYASAILAWLLNPALEHGLGFALLSEFVAGLAEDHAPLSDLRSRLTTRLRTDGGPGPWQGHHIELYVIDAFVDIVVLLDDWVLAVENKIFPGSVEAGQLTREYTGLRRHFGTDPHIAMVYLVPAAADGPLDPRIEREFASLNVSGDDIKRLVTWQAAGPRAETGRPLPSVEAMLRTVLAREAGCEITPISEYTRHTLKALCRFIADGFAGYDYERPAGGGLNPLTEEQLDVTGLAARTVGYVGVRYGLAGLVEMPTDRLTTHHFQYATGDMAGRPGWLPIALFNDVVRWLRGEGRPDIVWDFDSLPSSVLGRIAADYPHVYIGIQGGKAALEQMTVGTIREKKWGIRPESGGPQWVSGTDFHAALVAKGVRGGGGDPPTGPATA